MDEIKQILAADLVIENLMVLFLLTQNATTSNCCSLIRATELHFMVFGPRKENSSRSATSCIHCCHYPEIFATCAGGAATISKIVIHSSPLLFGFSAFCFVSNDAFISELICGVALNIFVACEPVICQLWASSSGIFLADLTNQTQAAFLLLVPKVGFLDPVIYGPRFFRLD
ncbi:hypothetical protein LguiB_020421 [Lonicera macranthoides]